MLGKLIKYDLLFGLKQYGVLFLLLCGTWLSGLAVSLIGNSYLSGMFLMMNVIISIVFIAAYAITSIQFYYKALSGGESYLNYTVPVNTVSLVFSKLAAIWIWGAAMAGTLALTWVSLYHTLIVKMGLAFEIPEGILDFVIPTVIVQFLMFSCLLAFAISAVNTPKLKSTNAGIVLAVVSAYVLSQAVGIVQLGLTALWLYVTDVGILKAIWDNNLLPGQEMLLLNAIQAVIIISSTVLAALFFLLTVRTVEKCRSI